MEDLAADFIIENNQPLEMEAEISEPEHFDCSFELYAAGTTWGSISGTLSNQTDLQAALDLKADKSEVESVTGALADSIQAVDNKYDSITSGLDDSITAIDNKYDSVTGALDDKIDSINGALADSIEAVDNKYNSITGGLSDDIDALESVVSANYNTLSDSISAETTARQNADSIIGDSITALDNKFDSITGGLSDSIIAIDNTINNYGDIVNYDAADFATSIQGALADTALQPNDNISELNNDVGYITSASLPTVNNSSIIFQKNGTNFDTITLNQSNNDTINISVPTSAAEVNALPDTTTINDLTTSTQQAALNSGANTTNIGQIATNTNAISTEVTNRQNADIALQNQIDAIVSSSDVFDIVGTYAELQAYDIATVPVNDIIKVLVDSTHNNAATYYRCVETGGVKSWSYIGAEGAYYTKSESDSRFVPLIRTVNGIALSSDITLTASDVNALPDTTVIPTVNNSTITIQKNGAAVDTFTLNQSTAKTINITVPTDTGDLTNGAGFISGITSADVTNALGYTPYNSTNPNGYITSSALTGYATENWVNNQGFITGITSSDIITALTYTPYDASNPDGFITSAALANYVTTDTAQDISGRKTFLGEKAIYFKQSATTNKLGFTLYNPSDAELGAFEYRPNTISGKALLNVNCPYTGDYVGFRYWGTAVNVVAPKVATAGTYYIPTHITDGNTTVTASNTGSVNISSLLPDISTKQDTLVSGTNIKTISNTSLLGSGDIDPETQWHLVTNLSAGSGGLTILGEPSPGTFAINIGAYSEANDGYSIAIGENAITNDISAIQIGHGTNSTANSLSVGFFDAGANYPLLDGTTGLIPDARISSNIARTSQIPTVPTNISSFTNDSGYITSSALSGYATETWVGQQGYITGITSSDVTTALGYTPVNKSGDTMTGDLSVVKDAPTIIMQNNNANADYTSTTSPSADIKFLDFSARDKNNNYTGGLSVRQNTANNFLTMLYARRKISGTEYSAYFNLYVDSSGGSHCSFPQTTCCDGQWVSSSQSIISSSTSLYNSGGSALGYRISLPNDGHNYEVLVTGRCTTSSTSGHFADMACNGNGDGATFGSYICGCRTRTNSSVDAWGSTIVVCKYVASGSNNFWLQRTTNSNGDGTCAELTVVAYRRIGTNS